MDRESGKAGVLAPTTHLHLPKQHPRPVHVQAEVTTTGSPDRMEFHQNVSCRPNDGTKAEERGRQSKDPPVRVRWATVSHRPSLQQRENLDTRLHAARAGA